MRKQNTELTASRASYTWQYWENILVVLTNSVSILSRYSSFTDSDGT